MKIKNRSTNKSVLFFSNHSLIQNNLCLFQNRHNSSSVIHCSMAKSSSDTSSILSTRLISNCFIHILSLIIHASNSSSGSGVESTSISPNSPKLLRSNFNVSSLTTSLKINGFSKGPISFRQLFYLCSTKN